jgi:predicted transcriptional regulator
MKTAKEEVRMLLESLPDDVSMDEILQRIEVLQSIERGLSDAQSGRVIPHATVVERLSQWKHGLSGR